MTRPAPLSPHFPYTTLFRSSKAMQRWTRFQTSEASAQLCPSSFFLTQSGRTNLDRAGHLLRMSERDRKSTRLNSSHGSISYAVFCLKKKKYKSVHHQRHTRL